MIYTLLEEHVYKGHSFETNWALYLAKIFNVKIPSRIASNLFEFIDSCNLIMALDLRKKGLIASNTKIGSLQDIFDEESLQNEHWLLVYEAIYHKWITPKDPKIIDNHPFFSLLKNHNVSFYHSNRNFIKRQPAKIVTPKLIVANESQSDIEALLDLFNYQASGYA